MVKIYKGLRTLPVRTDTVLLGSDLLSCSTPFPIAKKRAGERPWTCQPVIFQNIY